MKARYLLVGLMFSVLAVQGCSVGKATSGPKGAGKEMQVKVVYDDSNRVDVVNVLKDERWIRVREIGKPDAAGQAKPEATSSGS